MFSSRNGSGRSVGARGALALALAILPLAAQSQQASRAQRIGVLNEAWAANHPTVEGLRAGLRELGFEEGRDVVFDIRFTQGKPEATPAAAEALVKAGVDLIFTSSEAATQAAKNATQRIPIVFTLVGDPVMAGILQTIAKPGGNLTGISSLATELAAKRLEILKTLAPNVRRVWAIHHGDDPSSIEAIRRAEVAAKLLKVDLVARPVYTPNNWRTRSRTSGRATRCSLRTSGRSTSRQLCLRCPCRPASRRCLLLRSGWVTGASHRTGRITTPRECKRRDWSPRSCAERGPGSCPWKARTRSTSR